MALSGALLRFSQIMRYYRAKEIKKKNKKIPKKLFKVIKKVGFFY